ncbi:hypothetical protein Efla_000706 [Eimeria flavescens]
MSDSEDGSGSPNPPAFQRLRLAELQQFCLGPNSRDRVLGLLQKATAGEILQQTAAAADALTLQQEASSDAEVAAAKRALLLATATGDQEAADDVQQLLELLLKAIKRCFEVEDLRDSILSQPEMRPLLIAAAASPLTAIRELLAQQLKLIAKRGERGRSPLLRFFIWGLELHRQLLCLLADDETSVASPAEAALALICAADSAPHYVLQGAFLNELKRLAIEEGDAVCFRVLSPLIHGSIQKRSFFAALRSEAPDVLERLQQILTNQEDILLQSNACDLLSALTTVTWGMDFLISEKYPEVVARMLCEDEGAEVDEVENQTLMRLLCSMAAQRPPECARLMELQDGLLTTTLAVRFPCLSLGLSEEGMAYWSILCSSAECVPIVLHKLPDSADCIADCLADVEELAAAALCAWLCAVHHITNVFDVPEKMRQTISSKLTPKLLDCVLHRPFPEFRQKAYELLKALVIFADSMHTVFASEEFRKLMVDPTSDSEYEVRIAKHAFARQACDKQEEWLREALDPAFCNEFFRYAKGSPFANASCRFHFPPDYTRHEALLGRSPPPSEAIELEIAG